MKNLLQEKFSTFHCVGCGACAAVCHKNAIAMREDEFGFIKPVFDESLCVNCGKCEQVCPKCGFDFLNPKIEECYAARASDEIRAVSSSGGAFTVFANHVLRQGGVVCGCEMKDDFSVVHSFAQNEDELAKFRGSKYVESRICDCFEKIAEYAGQGRQVLFSGTPCQCAAVKKHLSVSAPKCLENIVFVDLLCHGVPSQKMMRDYLRENFDVEKIKEVKFRNKTNGWGGCSVLVLVLVLVLVDGSELRLDINQSAYETAFHKNIALRDGCENCEFCGKRRVGDLTIGDAWGIESFDAAQNDGKGTSAIFVNNAKGRKFLSEVSAEFSLKSVPFSALERNRLKAVYPSHPSRAHFFDLYRKTGDFSNSVFKTCEGKFDIALVGNWAADNYGSSLTNYALWTVLTKSLEFDALLVERPKNSKWKVPEKPTCFKNLPYPQYSIAPYFDDKIQMKQLNDRCGVFLVGSDQLLNNYLYHDFGRFIDLDWVRDDKPKIAYAASFGHDRIFGTECDRAEMSLFLQKFDAVSVREKSGVELMEKEFGVSAVQVLDPVFLCPKEKYVELAKSAERCGGGGNFLFSYTLDLTSEKLTIQKRAAEILGLSLQIIADIEKNNRERTSKILQDASILYLSDVESWLANIINCKYMITDSFHGTCFAIIFHKPFVSIVNKGRGATRFYSILDLFGLCDRMVENPEEITENLLKKKIDWQKVDALLESEKSRSFEWLKNALQKAKGKKKPLSEYNLLDDRIDALDAQTNHALQDLQRRLSRLEKITGIAFLRKCKNFLKRKLPPSSLIGKAARNVWRKVR